jgi:hypothetical protein
MKKLKLLLITILAALLVIGLASTGVQAEEGKPDASADKTGTNPVNFQRDIRIYNDYQWLNVAGDGDQNVTTLEFRSPFASGKWQFRARAYYSALDVDYDNPARTDVNEDGFGDLDMRFLTVPYVSMAKKQAVATGLEVFFDTASEDRLGAGSTSLGPQVFYVKFLKSGLFAPGLQYKFSVDEEDWADDVDQLLIDLNYLKMSKSKTSWFFTDPQIVIDLESNIEFMIVDLEWGWMMSKWTDLKGHSFYIRPSFGVGGHRPLDGSIEIGYKIVGW